MTLKLFKAMQEKKGEKICHHYTLKFNKVVI